MVTNSGASLGAAASVDAAPGTRNGITWRMPLPTPCAMYRFASRRESPLRVKLIEYPVFRVHSMANRPLLALSASTDHWQRGNTCTITTNCALRSAAKLEREATVRIAPRVAHARKRIPIDIIMFIRARGASLNQAVPARHWESFGAAIRETRSGRMAANRAGHGGRAGRQSHKPRLAQPT